MDGFFGLGAGIGLISLLLTVVPFLIVAGGLVWLALRLRNKTNAVQNWPETVGTILSSEVEMRRSRSGESGYTTAYYPKVLYEYQVGGQRYQSEQISAGFAMGLGSQSAVQAQIAKYPPGTNIRVYFNPTNPSQSVLDKSANPATKLLGGAALFIVVMLCITTGFMVGLFYVLYRVMGSLEF